MATEMITCCSCERTAKKSTLDLSSELCNYCYDLAECYNSMQDGEDPASVKAYVNTSFSKLKSVLKAKNLEMPADFIEVHAWVNGTPVAPLEDVEVEGHKHTTGILVADVAAELETNAKALRARLRKMGLNAPYNFTPELIESLKK